MTFYTFLYPRLLVVSYLSLSLSIIMSVVKEDINLSVFTSNVAVGSTERTHDYGLVGLYNSRVAKITMHVSKCSFGRIIVEKADGTNITVGSSVSSPGQTWEFEPDELFESIELFSNGKLFAGLRLLSNKRTYEALLIGYKPKNPPHVVGKGSGRLVGVFGSADTAVRSLGLALLR